jgi:hypothetical protein
MNDSSVANELYADKDRLDLLPLAFQRKVLRRAIVRRWVIVLGVCAALAVAIFMRQHHEDKLLQQALEIRRLRAGPLQALQSQKDALRKQLARIREDQQLRVELESEQLAFHLLATVSRSAATCIDNVQVQQFSFSRTRSAVTTQPVKTDGQSGQPEQTEIETVVMTVKGIGADNLTVSRFVVALRDSQMFDKVDLKSSVGGAGMARGIRSFVVECTL